MSLRLFFLSSLLMIAGAACATPAPELMEVPVTVVVTATPAPTVSPTATATPVPPTEIARETITVPIVVYILDSDDGRFVSQRTVEDLTTVYDRVNDIWAQADIQLDVVSISRVDVPADYIYGLAETNFLSFFQAVNAGEINLPQRAPIVGFYAPSLGGPNGINPTGSQAFFVMDTPSVYDERVTAHEIGHILGLYHSLDDRNRLLFSGTNGMQLTEAEQTVARYGAEGLLLGLR